MEDLERSRLTPNAKFRPNRRGYNGASWNWSFCSDAPTPQLDSVEGLPLTVGSVRWLPRRMKWQTGRCRGAYGTMAGVTGGRGGGHARQSQYSTTAKSGVNSQKALFILMQVTIPISKVRYRKGATATYLSHCHRYRRRGRLATTEGEESRVRGAWKPMGKEIRRGNSSSTPSPNVIRGR